MKAVQLVEVGKPLEVAEIPIPDIGSSEVLVRVTACGICHSDAHYRAGLSPITHLPVTPGHETAGVVESAGKDVHNVAAGDRVCVHYLGTCGQCEFCISGHEQFCRNVEMIGKHRDGGYAEFIRVPGRNVFVLPDEIPNEVAAVMMCSSATAFHALRKARAKEGESLAIFGFGGLGFSALQLAKAIGCAAVYAVDINLEKRAIAANLGAVPIDATADPVRQIHDATNGRGVDIAIDLVGSASTMSQAVRSLNILGRAAMVGLTDEALSVLPYPDLINKEAEIVGVSDHLATELPMLIEFASSGKLQFPEGTLRLVGLDAAQINQALDDLGRSTNQIRTVIVPGSLPDPMIRGAH